MMGVVLASYIITIMTGSSVCYLSEDAIRIFFCFRLIVVWLLFDYDLVFHERCFDRIDRS